MTDPRVLKIDEATVRAAVEALSKSLADDGKLIEAGFVGLCAMAMPPGAPLHQRSEMRKAFFAGAHHLFTSIMSILAPGSEPTAADLRRMTLIHEELQRFGAELQAEARKGMQ